MAVLSVVNSWWDRFCRLQCTSLLLAADVCSKRLHNSVTDRTTQQLDISDSLHVRIAVKWHSAVLEIIVDNVRCTI